MDKWLAQIYGTGGGEDIEKVAQAEMLQQLAAQEGIDLSQLSDEQLQALAEQISSEQAGGQPGQPQPGMEGQPQPGQPGMEQGQPGQEQGGEGGLEVTPELIAHAQEILSFAHENGLMQAEQPQAGAQMGGQPGMPQGGVPQPGQQAGQGQPAPQAGAAKPGQPQPGQAPAAGSTPPQEHVEEQMAKEAAAKFEEADFLGRVMAHSYTQELDKIASAREVERQAEVEKLANRLGALGHAASQAAHNPAVRGGAAAGGLVGAGIGAVGGAAGGGEGHRMSGALKGGLAGGAVGAAGGAAAGHHMSKVAGISKIAEAIEVLRQAGLLE